MPVDRLRRHLSELRRRRIRILPLVTALDLLREGAPVADSLVLTVDDGYADFHDLALPVFAELECPVTVFLVSGFLDHGARLWWDTVRAALTHRGKAHEADATIERLKRVPEAERVDAVDRLAHDSNLDHRASADAAPMTWDMVRTAAARGVTFGPHTVTHPVLSRVGNEQASHEIEESWRRVRQETDAAIPVFCYPNGGPDDQTAREGRLVRDAGLRAAVTTIPGFLSAENLGSEAAWMALPRFPFPANMASLLQIVGGLERLKRAMRHSQRKD
jgi:peptidoglycan/xylan/chitin deacetylase (PgdA/CDA1 family)